MSNRTFTIIKPDSVRKGNFGKIISRHNNIELVVVISALGKTTNALEEVAQLFFKKNTTGARKKIDELEKQHDEIARALVKDRDNLLYSELQRLFTRLRETGEIYHTDNYNFLYDQIVSMGELLSTRIMAAYLQTLKLNVTWLDARMPGDVRFIPEALVCQTAEDT